MRADRLISLMLLLNAHGRMTAQTLARQLGVSERTIYRDLDALSASGIPIYTQGGVNGGVFLDEHYRISLTGLTSAEVRTLFVSEGAGPLADLGLERAVTDTLLKLFAALPSSHQAEVERLRGRFHIDPANWFQVSEPSPFLPILQHAVWEDRAVEVRYQVVEGQVYEGVLNPYALVAKANVWYLVAEKLPKDAEDGGGKLRNYRLARLKHVALTDAHFEREPAFDLAVYWAESCAQFERLSMQQFPPFYATLRVQSSAFWYFPGYLEGRYHQQGAADTDGSVILNVRFDSLVDAHMRLIGLGTGVDVLSPDELRDAILATARAVVERGETGA